MARSETSEKSEGELRKGDIGVHELGSRWQISIQFVKSKTEYLFVELLFFSSWTGMIGSGSGSCCRQVRIHWKTWQCYAAVFMSNYMEVFLIGYTKQVRPVFWTLLTCAQNTTRKGNSFLLCWIWTNFRAKFSVLKHLLTTKESIVCLHFDSCQSIPLTVISQAWNESSGI